MAAGTRTEEEGNCDLGFASPFQKLDLRNTHRAAGLRAITFDVGGTLIEPWPSVGHVYAEVAGEHGLAGLDPAELNRRFAAAWRAHPEFQHTRSAWEELVDLTFAGLAEQPPSHTFFSKLYDRFSESSAWRIYPDVVPALASLTRRGVTLGVISNWDDRLRGLLQRLQLAHWFSVLVISCEAGAVKPQRAIFDRAAAQLGVPPGSILHVGDSLENDRRGAAAAGFRSVLLVRGAKQSSTGHIYSLAQLP